MGFREIPTKSKRRGHPKVTVAEKIFFNALRKAGIPFKRQQFVKGASGRSYLVDGVVDPMIVTPIDGAVHDLAEKRWKDLQRDRDLTAAGYTVIRFRNWEIYNQLGQCVAAIKQLRTHSSDRK